MTNPIFDFEDSSFAFPISDQFAISANGKPLMRLNDNIAVDINTGKPHFTTVVKDRALTAFKHYTSAFDQSNIQIANKIRHTC